MWRRSALDWASELAATYGEVRLHGLENGCRGDGDSMLFSLRPFMESRKLDFAICSIEFTRPVRLSEQYWMEIEFAICSSEFTRPVRLSEQYWMEIEFAICSSEFTRPVRLSEQYWM